MAKDGSISKLKGIETDAAAVTDAGAEAVQWTADHNLSWEERLNVAHSRAKYRSVVVEHKI